MLPPGPPEYSADNHDWRHWVRRLLICNPFFLCSAALLLFGVNRLSNDPNFLGDEIHNLLFNFFALQFYEVLVVLGAHQANVELRDGSPDLLKARL
jgi:hypothetical protein